MAEDASGLPVHSRYQVLTEGEVAWATDVKGTLYRFDGLRFTRRRRRDPGFSIVPSWQTPSYGWLHPSACPCAVWILPADGSRPISTQSSGVAA